MKRRKISKYESQVLVEALQDTIKEQVKNYLGTLEEIGKLLKTEEATYPPRLKSQFQKYYGQLSELNTELNNIKNQVTKLTDNLPTLQVWSFSQVGIEPAEFDKILKAEKFDTKSKKFQDMVAWESDKIYIISEFDPRKSDGKMGVTYFVGDETEVNKLVTRFKQSGELQGQDKNVTLPVGL